MFTVSEDQIADHYLVHTRPERRMAELTRPKAIEYEVWLDYALTILYVTVESP